MRMGKLMIIPLLHDSRHRYTNPPLEDLDLFYLPCTRDFEFVGDRGTRSLQRYSGKLAALSHLTDEAAVFGRAGDPDYSSAANSYAWIQGVWWSSVLRATRLGIAHQHYVQGELHPTQIRPIAEEGAAESGNAAESADTIGEMVTLRMTTTLDSRLPFQVSARVLKVAVASIRSVRITVDEVSGVPDDFSGRSTSVICDGLDDDETPGCNLVNCIFDFTGSGAATVEGPVLTLGQTRAYQNVPRDEVEVPEITATNTTVTPDDRPWRWYVNSTNTSSTSTTSTTTTTATDPLFRQVVLELQLRIPESLSDIPSGAGDSGDSRCACSVADSLNEAGMYIFNPGKQALGATNAQPCVDITTLAASLEEGNPATPSAEPTVERLVFAFLLHLRVEPIVSTMFAYLEGWGLCEGDCAQFPIIHGMKRRDTECYITINGTTMRTLHLPASKFDPTMAALGPSVTVYDQRSVWPAVSASTCYQRGVPVLESYCVKQDCPVCTTLDNFYFTTLEAPPVEVPTATQFPVLASKKTGAQCQLGTIAYRRRYSGRRPHAPAPLPEAVRLDGLPGTAAPPQAGNGIINSSLGNEVAPAEETPDPVASPLLDVRCKGGYLGFHNKACPALDKCRWNLEDVFFPNPSIPAGATWQMTVRQDIHRVPAFAPSDVMTNVIPLDHDASNVVDAFASLQRECQGQDFRICVRPYDSPNLLEGQTTIVDGTGWNVQIEYWVRTVRFSGRDPVAYFEVVPANVSAGGEVIEEGREDIISVPTLENQDRVEQRPHFSSKVRRYENDDLILLKDETVQLACPAPLTGRRISATCLGGDRLALGWLSCDVGLTQELFAKVQG